MQGIKHIVECHCVLPQFRKRSNPPFHRFVVFSIIDDADSAIAKHAKCNNCGVVHNVYDIGKSEILTGLEEGAVIEIEDIKLMIPVSLSNILDSYSCELPTWEQTLFSLQNYSENEQIILSKKEEDGQVYGKLLKFKSIGNYEIQPYSRKDTV